MNYNYIWKEIRHHRNRTLVNVLGIAVGIALFVSINAVSSAYQQAISYLSKTSEQILLCNEQRNALWMRHRHQRL